MMKAVHFNLEWNQALFFSILGLRIFFFQNIKVGGGKKIKITKKNVFI